ncbi:N-acetylmuramoyl-L-alanine amidase [Streptomyces sp. CA-100214]
MTTAPMTPDQWRRALRAEGVDFTELEGWTSRGRDAATGKIFGPVNGVLNHHTAGRNSLDLIAYRGQGAAVPPPLAHALLPKSGRLVLVADGRANHAGLAAKNAVDAIVNETRIPRPDKSTGTVDGNDRLYGLEVENLGDGEDVYTRPSTTHGPASTPRSAATTVGVQGPAPVTWRPRSRASPTRRAPSTATAGAVASPSPWPSCVPTSTSA